MKKYTLTALVLTLIAGICAALIACINLVTAPIITKNNEIRKAELCQEVFETYASEQSRVITEGYSSKSIKEIIMAYDSTGEFLGYIYTVEGSNAYGKIELLLGITADSRLAGVRFITNGQSFSSEANTHLNNSYKEDMTEVDVDNLDLKDSDVTAGATYASKLIRNLVKAAFEDANTRQGGTD